MTEAGPRILVVDDEPNITELVAMALRYEGFTVNTAGGGRDALAKVASWKPALVILDVMLPDLDGLEVLRRLGGNGRRPPVIFLTARDATEDKVHGLTVGGDGTVLETYISYLRRKIDRVDPPLIQTVRGVGYVLRLPRA